MNLAEREEFNNCLENLRWSLEHEGPSSKRPFMKCKPKMKLLKELGRSEDYKRDDFKFLLKGFDSLQEAFNFRIRDDVKAKIDYAKREAMQVGHEVSLGLSLPFWGDFQVFSRGAKGIQYILKSDKIEIFISSFSSEWGISVRYLSAALWQFGVEKMRVQVHSLLNSWSEISLEGKDYHRLSRVDVCIDFTCSLMRMYMEPSILKGIVMPQRVKNFLNFDSDEKEEIKKEKSSGICRGGYLETLTLGGKSALQLQIYDKALEIRESSRKKFFYDLWGRLDPSLKKGPKKGVWRFEARFFSPFLRNRMIRTFEEFLYFWTPLISEALTIRRLTVPSLTDKTRSRWPLHPIYCFLFDVFSVGSFSLPLGRYVTDSRGFFIERAVKQLAGSLRTYTVLKNYGIYDEDEMILLFQMARREIELDKRHQEKIERARERYKYVDCAA